MRKPFHIILILVTLALTAACTRQLEVPAVPSGSKSSSSFVAANPTSTEDSFPSGGLPTATIIALPTDKLPSQLVTPKATKAPVGKPNESTTPWAVIPTATDIPVSGSITPQGTAENASILGKHVVKEYETVDSIARAYGVDPKAIMGANNLTSQIVEVGKVLVIPPIKWDYPTYGAVAVPQFPPMYPNSGFSK